MSNWIESLKKLLIASHKKHALVADQDAVFQYPEVVQIFEEEGFEVFHATTDLEVRLTFELHVRYATQRCLIVAPAGYHPLPDIEVLANYQIVSLATLFPNLYAKSLIGLSFNALSSLSEMKLYETLGQEGTMKFLIEHLYAIDVESLTTGNSKERVIQALVSVLVENTDYNQPTLNFLERLARPHFTNLLAGQLSRDTLVDYLQKEWEAYIETGISSVDFQDSKLVHSLGSLFVHGHLKPIDAEEDLISYLPKSLRLGVHISTSGKDERELDNLVDYLHEELRGMDHTPNAWLKLMPVLANAKEKSFDCSDPLLKRKYQGVENSLNNHFQEFLSTSYEGLFSLSGIRKPVVVSRILDHISAQPYRKKALIVLDGMNYWQWNLIERELTSAGISSEPGASFAYIPTITAWSRQAIFRGSLPVLAENNAKEGKMFEAYWVDKDVAPYKLWFGRMDVNNPLNTRNLSDDISIMGLVCNDLDDIMHGSILGNEQLRASTEQWVQKSKIVSVLSELRAKGFQLFITADHGNIEATGLKNLALTDKVGTIGRSKRHVHFANEVLLASFLEKNQQIDFGRRGLSVYLKGQGAFTNENSKVITHGGSHLWEVIVPFIKIK